jgi:hypothetical protein
MSQSKSSPSRHWADKRASCRPSYLLPSLMYQPQPTSKHMLTFCLTTDCSKHESSPEREVDLQRDLTHSQIHYTATG